MLDLQFTELAHLVVWSVVAKPTFGIFLDYILNNFVTVFKIGSKIYILEKSALIFRNKFFFFYTHKKKCASDV